MTILVPGDVIKDTYTVERHLGEGAFAEVYRVKHRFMGRQAMKVFKRGAGSAEDLERDIDEALLLSGIRHPNLVEVFDANVLETAGRRYGYFTMTYMPGGTLERYWRSFGDALMPVGEVVEIARQVCRGLSIAHASNPPIVHRDIKPQNVLVRLVDDGLQVRLSDFGLARHVNPLTMLASARGTLGFKPPEALDNCDSASADVWSVGATCYLLLTDRMPFPSLGQRDVHNANRFLRPLPPPSTFNVDVDGGLESVLYRCLAAEPVDRYRDAAALLDDLMRWSPGRPASGMSQSTLSHKSALPERSPHDLKRDAATALSEALTLARNPMRLIEAADLLEEAISQDPALRARYEAQLELWRKGVMHVTATSPNGRTA